MIEVEQIRNDLSFYVLVLTDCPWPTLLEIDFGFKVRFTDPKLFFRNSTMNATNQCKKKKAKQCQHKELTKQQTNILHCQIEKRILISSRVISKSKSNVSCHVCNLRFGNDVIIKLYLCCKATSPRVSV